MTDKWESAWAAHARDGDKRRLAEMLAGSAPIPEWIRHHVASILDPVAYPPVDIPVASQRKINTLVKNYAIALAVDDAEKGGSHLHKAFIDFAIERLGRKRLILGHLKEARAFSVILKAELRETKVYAQAFAKLGASAKK